MDVVYRAWGYMQWVYNQFVGDKVNSLYTAGNWS